MASLLRCARRRLLPVAVMSGCVAFAAAAPGPGVAATLHDPGLSTLQVERRRDALVLELGFAPPDFELLLAGEAGAANGTGDAGDHRTVRERWLACARRHVVVTERGVADRAVVDEVAPTSVTVRTEADGSIVFCLRYPMPCVRPGAVHVTGFGRLSLGHACFVTVAGPGGDTLRETLLGRGHEELSWTGIRAPSSPGVTPSGSPPEPSPSAAPWSPFRLEVVLILLMVGVLIASRRPRADVAA